MSQVNARTGIYQQIYLPSKISMDKFCFKEPGGLVYILSLQWRKGYVGYENT